MRRRRNFDGCWTCRFRKVKCDTTRPKCLRCTKAGLDCEGYDIKLSFYQLLTISKGELIDLIIKKEAEERYHRRNVDFVKYPRNWKYLTYEKLNSIVDRLDSLVDNGNFNENIGPFSVYSINGGDIEIDSIDGRDESEGEDDNINTDELEFKRTLIDPDLLTLAKLTIFGIKGPFYKLTDQNIYHILYPTFFPNIDSDDWEPSEDSRKLIKVDNEGILLTKLYLTIVKEFNNLRLSFMKTNFQNPWNQVIAPYLKTILYETLIFQPSPSGSVPSSVQPSAGEIGEDITELLEDLKSIITSLILSISCFNLSGCKFKIKDNGSIDSYLKLSINLRKVSSNKLNHHLDDYDKNMELHDDEYNLLFLVSIILHIEIDNYFNIFENFDLLFSIGEVVFTQKNSSISLASKRLVVDNLFTIMDTFFISTQNTTLYNYKVDDFGKYGNLMEEYDLTKAVEYEMRENNHKDRDRKSKEPDDIEQDDKDDKVDDKEEDEDDDKDDDDKEDDKDEESKIKPYIIDNTDYNDYSKDKFEPELINQLTENSVYLMYGIPQSLIKLFNDIVHLTNHKRLFQLENKFPRNFPKICSEYEDKLYKWTNKWKLTKNGEFKSKFHQGLHYNIKIFHQCLTLFFNKLVKNEISQLVINNTYQDIAKILELNIDMDLTIWNLIILNFDNLNSNFKNTENYSKLINPNLSYWRAKQLIKELNNRRQDLEIINWMEIIREWDIVLYLG